MNLFRLLLLVASAIPGLAFAHVGHDTGIRHESALLIGFAHPFTGLDHLAAMIGVGIWSALTTRRVWLAPLAFASVLLVGGLLGFSGVAVPAVEPMIALSLLVLGLLLTARVKLPAGVGAALVGGFALFHGVAHGTELSSQHALAALGGMVAATLMLHAAGLLIGHASLKSSIWWPRAVGILVALLGMGLLGGAV